MTSLPLLLLFNDANLLQEICTSLPDTEVRNKHRRKIHPTAWPLHKNHFFLRISVAYFCFFTGGL